MICLVLKDGKTISAPTIGLALKAIKLDKLQWRAKSTRRGSFDLLYADGVIQSKRGPKIHWEFLGEFATVEPKTL